MSFVFCTHTFPDKDFIAGFHGHFVLTGVNSNCEIKSPSDSSEVRGSFCQLLT